VDGFSVDRHSVTNGDFLAFIEAGGYEDRRLWTEEAWLARDPARSHPLFWERGDDGEWRWRGMFESVPLPPDWPVYVTLFEAEAYARWRGERLMTEGEYQRAAFGTPGGEERSLPWGEQRPDSTRGNFGFRRWDPAPAGSYPAGASAWGIHDLVGNGWEWTASPFEPFSGFKPMNSYPQYSADFFDGKHYVMKGASPATPDALIRRSFRNWFRPNYPFVYAKFRLVPPDS
jgi:iron(II)-dependent oxidoreductase